MGILTSMWTAVSGMNAQGEALNVVADNIANSNTTGFKASRAEFADIMSRSMRGIDGGNQVGRGVRVNAVNPLQSQGNLDHTDRATDIGINGTGYFQVKGTEGVSYTRDGSFHFDKEGFLVNNDKQRVQGYQANEKGTIETKLGDVKFPNALINASATSDIKLDLNLDSRQEVGSKVFDPKDPYKTSHYATATEIFDSQGNKHILNLFFNKSADREWSYKGMIDGKDIAGGAPEGQQLAQACEGKLTFTENGLLNTQEAISSNFNFTNGAKSDQEIKFNFGDDIANGGKGMTGTKQFGKDSDIITWNQNGFSAGMVNSLGFNDEGILTASYSNGQVIDLGQIVLANFENPEALHKIGGNLFKQSRDSGEASVGAPRLSGRGSVMARSLERSNVDIAGEFVNMITNQRAFQANSKAITTSDELMNEVIQLKR